MNTGSARTRRSGRWVADPDVEEVVLQPRADGGQLVHSPLQTGADAGAWLPWAPGDFAPDQRRDNGLSLTFTTEDIVEGVQAFFEKREPQWKGR